MNAIADRAFQLCRQLTTVTILKPDGVVTLGVNVFDLATSLASIYVPADLVDSYKSASGWSNYASKIKPIPQ